MLQVWQSISMTCLILTDLIIICHPNAPSETLYLELGVKPIRFILYKRRVAYYCFLKKRPCLEVTKQIFDCQIARCVFQVNLTSTIM